MKEEKEYFPSMNRESSLQRLKDSLSFIYVEFDSCYCKKLSQSDLDAVFSMSNNPVAKFLRKNLLICTNEFYSKEAGICKEYTVNVDGFNFIYDKVTEKDPTFRLEDALDIYTNVVRENIKADKKMSRELQSLEFEYKTKSSRRWNNIQNIKREVKKRILVDYGLHWDYDIEGCATALLIQRAILLGLKTNKVPALMELYNNKNVVRERLSKELGLPIDIIKDIISGTFNGAKLSDTGDIFAVIGRNKETLDKLKTNPTLLALKEDMTTMWAAMKKDVLLSMGDMKGLENNRRLVASDKANYYFKLEILVNDCFIEHCNANKTKYFLQHDGFTTDKKIDVETLISEIKNKTGYDVSLTEDFLPEEIIKQKKRFELNVNFLEKCEIDYKIEQAHHRRAMRGC